MKWSSIDAGIESESAANNFDEVGPTVREVETMVHWIWKFAGSDDFDAVGSDHLRFVGFRSLGGSCGAAAGKEGNREQSDYKAGVLHCSRREQRYLCTRSESFRGHNFSIDLIHGFQVPMPQRARRQYSITTNGTLSATSSDRLKP
jgi:hypothetical protein